MDIGSSNLKHVAVAITGASGSCYGLRLVEALLQSRCRVSLIITAAGLQVLNYELERDWPGATEELMPVVRSHFQAGDELTLYGEKDLFAPLASGSAAPDAMVIAPCSMGSAGRIAAGMSGNLVERCADVMLKERRQLILVPRETPFNEIHLRNLLRLSRAGAQILPAMPAFYGRPQTMQDLIDFVVGKILDSLRLENKLFPRWGDPAVTE